MAKLILDYYRLQNEPFEDYSSLLREKPEKYWYPFEEGADILCVGTNHLQAVCACGINTTAIEQSFFKAQVFQNVENLTIYVGDLCDIPLQGNFDYILADRPDFFDLGQLVNYLKPKGKILVSTDETNTEIEEELEYFKFKYLRFYYLLSEGIYSEERTPTLEEYLAAVTSERLVSEIEYKKANAILTGKALSFFVPEKVVEAGRQNNLAAPIWKPVKSDMREIVLPVDQDEELISQVKEVQLSLLRELKRVCDRNGLKVFLFYGSLLGAVRHGGIFRAMTTSMSPCFAAIMTGSCPSPISFPIPCSCRLRRMMTASTAAMPSSVTRGPRPLCRRIGGRTAARGSVWTFSLWTGSAAARDWRKESGGRFCFSRGCCMPRRTAILTGFWICRFSPGSSISMSGSCSAGRSWPEG